MTIALIDGDILTWKSCFSAEYSVYELPVEEGRFRYRKEVDAFIDWNYDEEEGEYIRGTVIAHKIVEPFSKATAAADQIINSVLTHTGATSFEIYISGADNFRLKVDYPVVYKGNRIQDKPHYYQQMREWLVKKYGAKLADGMESDDMLSIRQHELQNDSIICSIDKDMKQVPGFHFNLDSKEIVKISKLEGFRNFAIQMLTGDRVDNIIGIDGLGPKKAAKLLEGLNTQEEMYEVVKQQYAKAFGEEANKMLASNLQLLMLKAVR
jgi:DNA polymerase-1